MITKVIFNIDKNLKAEAMKKAQKQGLSLSAILNITTRAFVENQIKIGAFEADLERAREEMRERKGVPAKDVYRALNIKK